MKTIGFASLFLLLTAACFGQVTINADSTLEGASVGVPYSVNLTPAGGTGPYTFRLTTGTLPSGVTLSNSGILSGTPATAGAATFSVSVQDSGNASAVKPFTLPVSAASLTFLPMPVSLPLATAGQVVGGANQAAHGNPAFTVRALALTISTATLPATMINSAYSAQITAIGGSGGNYVFSLTAGALPSGIALSSSGLVSGAANRLGSFPVTVTVIDGDGTQASRSYILVVASSLTVIAPPLPIGIVNNYYAATPFYAIGGISPYVYTIASGALPSGVVLNPATGIISGMPTVAGTAQFAVQATDATGQIAVTPTQSLQVNPGPLLPVPITLLGGTVGNPYSPTQFAAMGGAPPYSFTVISGSGVLPPGLTLSGAGLISGTPTTPGTYNFVVALMDTLQQSASRQYQIVITVPLLLQNPQILPSGLVGTPYLGATLIATGGVMPYSWSIVSGSFPPGLTLSSSGVIGGTPTAAGSFSFAAMVTDSSGQSATGQFQIVILAVLTANPVLLPNGIVNTAYPGAALTASGGTAPYSWTVVGGSLPPGLNLSPNGAISGTPATAGTYTFRARVTDSGVQSATQSTIGSYQIIVNLPTLQIVSIFLPTGTVNSPYPSEAFAATGGVPPYIWSIAAGALPPGLMLNAAGILSGTPTSIGTANFTVKVIDGAGNFATAPFQIVVGTAPGSNTLLILPATIPAGTVGIVYPAIQFTSDVQAQLTFSVSGQLPPGLSLGLSGLLTGTPTQSGVFTFLVTGTGSAGSGFTTITVRISASIITVSPSSIGPLTATTPSQTQFSAGGGTGPYTFSGCAVAGLTISPGGLLSGTPPGAGTFTCTVTATDSTGATGSVTVTITVVPLLTIAPFTLPSGIVMKPYDPVTLTATGGKPPYAWSIAAGSLPAGLGLSSTGTISGTPQVGGAFAFTVQVTDAAGAAATATGSILVTGAPVISGTVVNSTVGAAYTAVTFSATGGTKPYTFSVSGTLPPGLTLSADGVLSGTPTQAGSFDFGVVATDANKLSGMMQYTIRVAPAQLTIVTAVQGLVVSLPMGTAGAAYTQSFSATGGVAPYTWSITAGRLPNGLTLSPAGILSGTPQENGDFPFTVQVADSQQPPATASQAFDLVIGLPAFSNLQLGLPATIDPAQQLAFNVAGLTPFPVVLTGTLTVTADDPAVKFSNGSTTIGFMIPAGQTSAMFASPAILMSTGTVGGVLQFTTTLTAPNGSGGTVSMTPAPAFSTTVNSGPPVITMVTGASASGTLTFTIQGFATTRQVTQAKFHFVPAAGINTQTTDFTVDVNSAFTQWYQTAGSKAVGSLFSYTQPFTVQGQLRGSFTVTLVDDKGSSNTLTLQLQ